MNLTISGKVRNYIFIAVLVIIFISMMFEFSVAAKQDKNYRDNYILYQQATQLINEQQYTQAQDIIARLDQDSLNSYQVIYLQAICASNTGDLGSALDLIQKASEIRPALLMDQDFLLQYGIILYRSAQYEQAKLYFMESLKYSTNNEATQEADKYLTEINKMAMTGGRG